MVGCAVGQEVHAVREPELMFHKNPALKGDSPELHHKFQLILKIIKRFVKFRLEIQRP